MLVFTGSREVFDLFSFPVSKGYQHSLLGDPFPPSSELPAPGLVILTLDHFNLFCLPLPLLREHMPALVHELIQDDLSILRSMISNLNSTCNFFPIAVYGNIFTDSQDWIWVLWGRGLFFCVSWLLTVQASSKTPRQFGSWRNREGCIGCILWIEYWGDAEFSWEREIIQFLF